MNAPTSPESSQSEPKTRKSKPQKRGHPVDSPPEPPSLVVAVSKAAECRVEFELTTIVVNADDGLPDGYQSRPGDMAC